MVEAVAVLVEAVVGLGKVATQDWYWATSLLHLTRVGIKVPPRGMMKHDRFCFFSLKPNIQLS